MGQEFIRFRTKNEKVFFGEIVGDQVLSLDKAPWFGGKSNNEKYDLSEVTLLAPVEPSKVVCIGLNYYAHVKASYSADEAPEKPLVFFKPPSSIIGPNDEIVLPWQSERVDYEAELAVVIGKQTRNVSIENASQSIFGLTCVNDVTARDLQKIDGQWSRAKGFDTFCPVGPSIVTDISYGDILVEGILNDKVMQSGRTSQMIFKIPFLISYVSAAMTLEPGDLISTGTPSGISPMKPDDTIVVQIENVGRLENRVVDGNIES